MRTLAVIAGLLAGCRIAPPAPAIGPVDVEAASERRGAGASAAAAVPVPSEPSAPAVVPELPTFARLDLDVELAFPLRATIRTRGVIHETAEDEVGSAGDGASVSTEAFVLDEATTAEPRRVRVLCDHESHRIALFVDADDLMVTVREPAFASARPQPPKRVHDRTTGIHVEPGAPLHVRDEVGGLARVRYEGETIAAEGFLPARALDVVYTRDRDEWSAQANAVVTERARLHEFPASRSIARIDPTRASETRVVMLGPRRGRWRLVRYAESDIVVVGWIERRHLRPFRGEADDGRAVPPVAAREPAAGIVLPRGTRLVATRSDEVLGVVREDGTFECVGGCGSKAPLVRVAACAASMAVRAAFTDGAPRG